MKNPPINLSLNNRYQIEKELSQKAGRKTFLAKDTNSNDLVVIKLLQFNNSFFSWDDLKLFEREAETLQNLNHPAIPQYLDYFEVDNEEIRGFALVQTYIDAPSLETTIKQGRKFSEIELMELAEKLLDILTYLHQQNPPVIHRDIKPSNILLSNRSGNSIGDIYLIDFGSAQTMAKREGSTITIVGTYGYIPLEQFGGKTVVASDLYSLGMTLIYILTGVHPAQLTQTNGRVEFNNREINKKFKKWLEKISHPHLDKRFQSAESAKTNLISNDNSSNLGKIPNGYYIKKSIFIQTDNHKCKIVYEDINQIEKSKWLILGIFIIYMWIFLFLGSFFSPILWSLIFTALTLFPIRLVLNYFLSLNPFSRIVLIKSDGSFKKGIYKKNGKIKWDQLLPIISNKITKLAYNPAYKFQLDYDPKSLKAKYMRLKGRSMIIDPTLSISIGDAEYTIYSNYQKLSEAELLSLGKELSDFLGLELKTIYRKPVLPDEQTSE